MLHVFETSMVLPRPREEVFPFFADAGNLQRITPPELHFHIVTPLPVAMAEGALIDYRLRLFGLPFSWCSRIAIWQPPRRFVDEQVRGPYRLWRHTHAFLEHDGGTQMVDRVEYRLPLWPVGETALPLVQAQLRRIFAYRRRRIEHLLLGR